MAFDEQRSYNIHELDAASNNSVDDIRSLIDQVRIPPQIGKYKVYIIDEVHMLSTSAFNSFLKTLEEPPAHAIFILATTEKHKIIPTILSRCQVYDFNRISVADMVNHLQYVAQKENVSAEPEALNIIAQKADGGMRDALSIFDQTVSYTAGNVTYKSVIENLNVLDFEYYFKLTDAIVAGSVVDCLLVLNDILNRGFEGQYVISGITSHFRDLLVCKDPVTATLFEVGASIREKYVATAKQCSNAFLYKAIEMANDCDLNYRMSKNKRLLLELTLIKLCQLSENSEDPKNLNPVTPSEKVHPKTKTQPVQISGTVSEPKPEIKPLPVIPGEKKSTVTTIAGLGVSLSSLTEENPEKPVEKSISLQAEPRQSNRLFTEEELQKAWQEFAENLVEEKLLRNTMMLYKPKMLGNTVFEVEVNTEINKNYLDDYGNVILAYLRESLQNDDITMTIKISEATVVKKPLTSREIFDELVQKNPSLQKLSDEFDLELS
ncbi:hypothetical protein SDC9_68036 [bioreactor metagenome]|uniref:Uncharacterized protein n=1 Tax=bioreactor metagenome TaxID=1076179 RepID=A0A644XZA2_9ZZZZ